MTIGNITYKRQSNGRSQCFEAWSLEPITDEQCATIQTRAGYMPMGYGMGKIYRREVSETGSAKRYLASWSCSDSCD